MGLSEFDQALTEVRLDQYLEEKRPPEHIRPKLDIGYRVEDQNVFIFEIRPHWKTNEPQHIDVAKTTYIQKGKTWKVFWMRQDLKWHRYEPHPSAANIEEWLKVVEKGEHCCFWG